MPKKRKQRGSSADRFRARMQALPLPLGSKSLHGEVRQDDWLGKFLDRELIGGVYNPCKRHRNPGNQPLADLSGVDLDALDTELSR